jgi:hypothetical protein
VLLVILSAMAAPPPCWTWCWPRRRCGLSLGGSARHVAYLAFAYLVFGTTAAVLAYVVLARLLFGATAGGRLGHMSFRRVTHRRPDRVARAAHAAR